METSFDPSNDPSSPSLLSSSAGALGSKSETFASGRRRMRRLSTSDRRHMIHEHRRASALSKLDDSVACFMSQDNKFRSTCVTLMTHPWFEKITLFLIVTNSITLACEDPLTPPNEILGILEYVFNVLFTLEMFTKIFAMGLMGSKTAYLGDNWNRMDFFVVIMGWLPNFLSLFMEPTGANFTAIRVVRILKVLKTIQRVEGVRKLVAALLQSLPLLMNVANLLMFMFFIFGIFGLQLFQGQFRQKCFYQPTLVDWDATPDHPWRRVDGDDWSVCKIGNGAGDSACAESEICAMYTPFGESGVARTSSLNNNPGLDNIGFDNIFSSFLTILTVMSLEGWTDIMGTAIDTAGPIAYPYFMMIVILGSLFAVNLVVAVIYEAYISQRPEPVDPTASLPLELALLEKVEAAEKLAAAKALLDKEAALKNPMKWCLDTDPYATPSSHLYLFYARSRDAAYNLSENDEFGTFITVTILFNTLFMSLEFHGADQAHLDMLDLANMIFTWIFTVEMVIKLWGYGPMNYKKDGYNIFDGVIVLFSWFDYFFLRGGGPFSSFRTFRLLRVLRTLKLAKSWHSLNQLLITIVRSIPGLANFGVILMLFLFIYALFGMQFYGGKFTLVNGFDATPRANFDALRHAVLTVFQVVTGENWNEVMYDCMQVNGVVGAVYVATMYCIGNYIVLNLFLAILLDNFQSAGKESSATFYDELEKQNDITAATRKFAKCVSSIAKLICPGFMKARKQARELEASGRGPKASTPIAKAANAKVMDENTDETAVISSPTSPLPSSSSAPPQNSIPAPRASSSIVDKLHIGDLHLSKLLFTPLDHIRKAALSEEFSDTENDDEKDLFDGLIHRLASEPAPTPPGPQPVSASYKPPPVTVTCIRKPYHLSSTDDLMDFALEQAENSIEKIHANVVSIFGNDKIDVISTDLIDERLITQSTRTSISRSPSSETELTPHLRKLGLKRGSSRHITESSRSSHDHSPFPKAKKPTATNLESARHETMMDDDLKNDFTILKKFMKGMELSLDIRTRRRRAKTFLNCFTGEEIVDFLLLHNIVKDSTSGEAMCQKLLEVGFIDRSLPPLVKGKKLEEKEALELEPPVTSPAISPETSSRSLNSPDSPAGDDVELFIDTMTESTRTRGATMLATRWEGDYMIFSSDVHRLYCIGDISPSTVNLMGSTGAQKARKLKREQAKLEEKRTELLKKPVTLGLLGRSSPLRLFVVNILCQAWFENLILLLIFFSSILLAIDEPSVALTPNSPLAQFLNICDYVMTTLFVIEMSLKITAMGFLFGEGSYLRNSWNVLDFFIVCVSLFGLAAAGMIDLSFLKSLRAMRGLRPLRMISRAPGMKMIVNAIFVALPACVNVVLVVMLCFLVFAIVGTTFFSGLFFWCKGDGDLEKYSLNRVDCIGTWNDGGVEVEREWVQFPHHFDSVPQGMTTLFEIASLEMWPEIMAVARDVTSVDMHPVLDNAFAYSFFFVLFIFIGSFFVINLFVGVVINKFGQVKAEGDGNSLFMSKEAQDWVKAQKAIMGSNVASKFKSPIGKHESKRAALIAKLDEEQADMTDQERGGRKIGVHPDGEYYPTAMEKARTKVFELVESHKFDNFIMSVIMISIVTMAMPYLGESQAYTDGLVVVDFVWNGIFISEMLLKNLGLGPRQYFSTGWNKFDCTIVFFSIFDMAASGNIDIGIDVKILRVLRVARMLRLVRHNKPLLNLFMALFTSLPSLGNVGSILLLCLYVYAVMGMNLFSDVTLENYPDLEFINERTNFGTFGYSMLTLFRSATGESWNGVMHEIVNSGFPAATPFFVSFVVICTFIMLNLFIAVILENFNDAQAVDKDKDFNADHIEAFGEEWAKLDLEGDYFLEGFKLVGLLYALPPPLGLKGQEHKVTRFAHELNHPEKKHVIQYIRELGIKRDKYGLVFFLDVLSALVKKGFGLDGVDVAGMDAESFDSMNKQLVSSMTSTLKDKMNKIEANALICDLSEEFNCACAIQCAFRGKLERRVFYQRVVDEGKWTKRMDHLYSVTLGLWSDEVLLADAADERVARIRAEKEGEAEGMQAGDKQSEVVLAEATSLKSPGRGDRKGSFLGLFEKGASFGERSDSEKRDSRKSLADLELEDILVEADAAERQSGRQSGGGR